MNDDLSKDQKNKPWQFGLPVEVHTIRIPVRFELILAMASLSVHSHCVEQPGDLSQSGSLPEVSGKWQVRAEGVGSAARVNVQKQRENYVVLESDI